MVFGHAKETGLSKAKLLLDLDDTKWVLNLGYEMFLLQAEA